MFYDALGAGKRVDEAEATERVITNDANMVLLLVPLHRYYIPDLQLVYRWAEHTDNF
jgi:hypothetical protein